MNKLDAFKILGLTGEVTPKIIKEAYRRASMKFHPDRNPAGHKMMQMVNLAFEAIKDYCGLALEPSKTINSIKADLSKYGENLCEALNKIINFGLNIEVCGAWVWVDGNTKPYKDVLKENGFKWAPKKTRWYYRPSDFKSRSNGSWSMSKIREFYGSSSVEDDQKSVIAIKHSRKED